MRISWLIIPMLLFTSLSFAGSSIYSGTWEFTIDNTLDGRLTPTKTYLIDFNGHLDQMMGSYRNIDNDSNWEFKFYSARGGTIVSGIQRDSTYYRVLNGKLNRNSIQGTWYDVAGNSGDFKMTKK